MLAEKIEAFAKANDDRFMYPIRKAVSLFTKDEAKIKKVTHIFICSCGAKYGIKCRNGSI